MTGTADTEAYEFQSIYGLEVVVIPTHMPMIRKDHDDLVFLKADAKYRAIIDDVKDCVERGQPVLVGTTSIEISELICGMLRKQQVDHEVLNAKQHAHEAAIVAQAGRLGAVTIAQTWLAVVPISCLAATCPRSWRSSALMPPMRSVSRSPRLAAEARRGGGRGWAAHHRHGTVRRIASNTGRSNRYSPQPLRFVWT